jgi:hypothetical protein
VRDGERGGERRERKARIRNRLHAEIIELLKTKGGVLRIGLQQFERLIGNSLHVRRHRRQQTQKSGAAWCFTMWSNARVVISKGTFHETG